MARDRVEESPMKRAENLFEGFIFWSRWVQAPMYGGLVAASFMYVYIFFRESFHLWSKLWSGVPDGTGGFEAIPESQVMIYVLVLVDITMVINLLVMVTIGGYSIFTSRIDVEQHEDKPMWLEHLDAGRLKIKLAASLASISGVHLLKTFIDVRNQQTEEGAGVTGILIEIAIHFTFIISALLLAYVEKVQHAYHGDSHKGPDSHEGDEPQKNPNPPKPSQEMLYIRKAALAAIQAQKRAEAAAKHIQDQQKPPS